MILDTIPSRFILELVIIKLDSPDISESSNSLTSFVRKLILIPGYSETREVMR